MTSVNIIKHQDTDTINPSQVTPWQLAKWTLNRQKDSFFFFLWISNPSVWRKTSNKIMLQSCHIHIITVNVKLCENNLAKVSSRFKLPINDTKQRVWTWDTWHWPAPDCVMWVNHLISNAGWVWRPHAWHIAPDIAILVTDDPSHINIRNLSSTPSPDWGLLITHSSHYLKSRVSIIKLDPDDAGLTRTKIEEGELGEAEVWRRGTRWHQDKERWMMVVATGDKHWQEGLRPGERVSYSPQL